jgi:hypothetical protein
MVPSELVKLTEMDTAWAVRGPGARLDAVRRAGRRLRDRILTGGVARCVRTVDVATFPYPTRYALQGVATSPVPYVFMRNRMHLVQVTTGARVLTILVNPTDPQRSTAAPYFARLEERYGTATRRLLSTVHTTIPDALTEWGIAPESIDYITFDHLHVQDVRGLLAPGPDGRTCLPNAKLLAQQTELEALAQLHRCRSSGTSPTASPACRARRSSRSTATTSSAAASRSCARPATLPAITRSSWSPARVRGRSARTACASMPTRPGSRGSAG